MLTMQPHIRQFFAVSDGGVRLFTTGMLPRCQALPRKERPLEPSVTVVLPVHNVEATLHGTVQEILDVLPDLTHRFDVLIVDDGSTDGTREIAHDLARDYPQVRVCSRGSRLGRAAAIHAALEQSQGEVVLLHEEDQGTPIDAIHRLWQSIAERALTLDPPQAVLSTAGIRARISSRAPRPGFRVITAAAAPLPDGAAAHGARSAQSDAGKPRGPNYLGQTKRFALDE